MRVGTICYATSRGLGHLPRDFHRHGIITDVCVMRHRSIPMNEDWYPDAPVLDNTGPDAYLRALNFCREMDAVIWFENPFFWELIPELRKAGVRTYLVTMYECHPRSRHYGEFTPTKYLCPSELDMEYFPYDSTQVWLPVEYPWRLRERALHYVHNGGYLGIRGREGTTILIEAMRYVKSPLRLTIRVQENVADRYQRMTAADSRIEYINRQVPYEELYGEGDVCVGAQKWNGCSLPLQEAFASGMCIINTNRHPTNGWLPAEPLVDPDHVVKNSRIGPAYLTFDESIVNPETLAAKMDELYGKDITEFSMMGKSFGESNSWERLKPTWEHILSGG